MPNAFDATRAPSDPFTVAAADVANPLPPTRGIPFGRVLFGASTVVAGVGAFTAQASTGLPAFDPTTATGWVEFLRLGPLALAVLGGWWGMRKDAETRQATGALVVVSQKGMEQMMQVVEKNTSAAIEMKAAVAGLTDEVRELRRMRAPCVVPPAAAPKAPQPRATSTADRTTR